MSPRTPLKADLLYPSEVAAMFRVNVATVTRWANGGTLTFLRTPGNHRRYYRAECERLLNKATSPATVRALPAREDGAA